MAKSIMQSQHPFWKRIFQRWHTPKQDPISALMRRRMLEVQRGEFEFIGTITQICVHTHQGERWLVFPPPMEGRPTLARFMSDSLPDLIDPWPYDALPTIYMPTDELCPDCLVRCEECGSTEGGYSRNVGGGIFLHSRRILIDGVEKVFLPGERPCIYGDQWNACGGTGIIRESGFKCVTCEGTGHVGCKRCGGDGTSKKMGTGLMASGKTPDGKSCPSCGGTGRVRTKVEQSLLDYVSLTSYSNPLLKIMGETLYLGPIVSMWVVGQDKHTQIWKGDPDDEGHYPHIVSLKHFQRGSRAVILGGVLRLIPSTRSADVTRHLRPR